MPRAGDPSVPPRGVFPAMSGGLRVPPCTCGAPLTTRGSVSRELSQVWGADAPKFSGEERKVLPTGSF